MTAKKRKPTGRPPGRPKKSAGNTRSVRLEILLTPQERSRLGERADRFGVGLRDLLVPGGLTYVPPGMENGEGGAAT